MRTPKKKPSMEVDVMIPFDISKLGTNEDPCFGKLYEPATKECHACGDSELCAIVHMHHITKERKKVEKKINFKDTEEAVSKSVFIPMLKLKNEIQDRVSNRKGRTMPFKMIVKSIQEEFDPENLLPDTRIRELCIEAIKHNKNLQKYKENGKIHIKYVPKHRNAQW